MRYKYQNILRDGNGVVVTDGTVSVYLAGTTTAASVYTSSTSTSAVNSVTSNSTDGSFVFYVDAFDYGSYQQFKTTMSKTGFTSYTEDNISITDVVPGTYSITTAKTFSNPVFIPKNVTYSKGTGGSITISSSFEAGNYQVFSGFGAGEVVFSSGSVDYVNSKWFGTLNTTITVISTNSAHVLLNYAETLTANLTIPATCALDITKSGSIAKASTYTLTINGPFSAGLYQVFSGFSAGNVTFTAGTKVQTEWFGVNNDGTTANTVAFNSAHSAAGVGGSIIYPVGNYATGSISVLNKQKVYSNSTKLTAKDTPTEIFKIDGSATKGNIEISGFEFAGNSTYRFNLEDGDIRFIEIKNNKNISGSGTAIVRMYNDSGTTNQSRIKIINTDARASGYTYGVHISRGAVALAAGVALDNIEIDRLSHWADLTAVYISSPVPHLTIRHVYGGLFNVDSHVINYDPDTVGLNFHISDIHMEVWLNNGIAVNLGNVQYGIIHNIEAIRVGTTQTGIRAVKLTGSKYNEIKNWFIKNNSSDPSNTPSGYYPGVELDATSSDNDIYILDRSLIVNRISDLGVRNRIVNDKNDDRIYTANSRVTVGAITDETTLKTVSIDAGAMGTTGSVKVTAFGSVSGTNDTKTIRFKWGGSTITGGTITFAAGETGVWKYEVLITNNSATAQRILVWAYEAGVLTENYINATIDTASAAAITITGQKANASDVINGDTFIVERIDAIQAA